MAAALERRFEVHPCGRIIEFASGGCPYKEHLYELEEEQVLLIVINTDGHELYGNPGLQEVY